MPSGLANNNDLVCLLNFVYRVIVCTIVAWVDNFYVLYFVAFFVEPRLFVKQDACRPQIPKEKQGTWL